MSKVISSQFRNEPAVIKSGTILRTIVISNEAHKAANRLPSIIAFTAALWMNLLGAVGAYLQLLVSKAGEGCDSSALVFLTCLSSDLETTPKFFEISTPYILSILAIICALIIACKASFDRWVEVKTATVSALNTLIIYDNYHKKDPTIGRDLRNILDDISSHLYDFYAKNKKNVKENTEQTLERLKQTPINPYSILSILFTTLVFFLI